MNKRIFKFLLFLSLILSLNCSDNISGGFGSETSNGMISSTWYNDSTNNIIADALIELVPALYNSLKDDDSNISKTFTDEYGNATFDSVPFGTYNLVATSINGNKKAVFKNVTISNDSTYQIVDTLSNSGSTKLFFSQLPANTEFGCYIPGINSSFEFDEAIVDSNGEYVLVMNNLPEMDSISIYGYQQSADKQFLITDSNNVESEKLNSLLVDLVWSAYKYSDDSTIIGDITSVVSDSSGNTWFSQTGMIIKIDTNGNAVYYKSDDIGLPIFPIRNSILDSAGNPMFSTSNGIIRYDGNSWTKWDIYNNEFIFQNILLRTCNQITGQYCFTSNNGVRFLDSDTTLIFSEAITIDGDTVSLLDITSLNADADGKLWVGSRWDGVLIYENGNWTKFTEKLPSQVITDIVTYNDGRVIISTDSGVLYNDGTEWQTFENSNSPLTNCIRGAFAKNSLWIISEYNLYRFKGTEWSNFNEENSMVRSSEVTFLTIDEDKNRGYLGTKEGIFVFDYR